MTPTGVVTCKTIVTTPTLVAINASVSTSTSNVALIEGAILVAWKSGDLDLFTPKSAPLLHNVTFDSGTLRPATSDPGTSISSTIASPSSTASTGKGGSRQGGLNTLSSAALVGIGVGIAIACFVIVGVVIFFFLRHKRRGSGVASRPELEDTSGAREREHLDGPQMLEANPNTKPAEADSSPRAELEGGWQGHEAQQSVRSSE